MTKSGRNITDRFELAFLLGFIILTADFINSAFLAIFYRYKAQSEEREFGTASSFTRWMTKVTITSEYALRLLMSICAVFQYTVVHSKFGDYCVRQSGLL